MTPQDTVTNFSRPVTFHVSAVSDPDTPVSYTWMHQGVQLENRPGKIFIETGGNLTINATEESDLGKYTCVATNGISTVEASAQLNTPGYVAPIGNNAVTPVKLNLFV